MTRDDQTVDRGIRPPEVLLGFLLSQLAGIVRQRTAEVLEPLEISPRSLGLLLALAEQTGTSQVDVARRLRIDRTTMSQLVDELTRAGLIDKAELPSDRRHNTIALTAEGTERLRAGSFRALAVERDITIGLGDERLTSLKAALQDLLIRSDDGGAVPTL